MNKIASISFIGMMISCTSAQAQVDISVPDNVEILVANGVKPHLKGSLFDSEKTLLLPDGQQQIVFRYEPYFAQGKDNIGVESDVIVASFSVTDTSLSFRLPKYRHAKDARKYIKNLEWSLIDKQGKAIHLREDKLKKEGMQFGRNFLTEMATYNQSNAAAAVINFAPQAAQQAYQQQRIAPIAATQTTSVPVSASTAETMLHYWYDKADNATKARFKQFINQQ